MASDYIIVNVGTQRRRIAMFLTVVIFGVAFMLYSTFFLSNAGRYGFHNNDASVKEQYTRDLFPNQLTGANEHNKIIENITNPLFGLTTDGFKDSETKNTSIITLVAKSYVNNGTFGKIVLNKKHLIVYNHVPKCGGRTLTYLFAMLVNKGLLGSIIRTHLIEHPSGRPDVMRKKLNELIRNIKLPSAVAGHFHYYPIDKSLDPIYINIIRDPLSRMVSRYYFLRFGDEQTEDKVETLLHKLLDQNYINETFDECVLSRRNECTSNQAKSSQLRFFCGIDPKCSEPTEWALEQAKKTVEEEYLLVGVVEDFDAFLQVLESLAPKIFHGIANEMRRDQSAKRRGQFKSTLKIPPSEEIKAMMRKELDMEYKFYEFVKDRFNALKREFGLDGNVP